MNWPVQFMQSSYEHSPFWYVSVLHNFSKLSTGIYLAGFRLPRVIRSTPDKIPLLASCPEPSFSLVCLASIKAAKIQADIFAS